MSEFCVKCSEKEAEIELLRKQHYEEIQSLKAQIDKLQNENESYRNYLVDSTIDIHI
jgi:hypothetical protein